MKKQVFFFAAVLFACAIRVAAQDRAEDSVTLQRSVASVRTSFMQSMGAGTYLYTGIAFERYWNRVTGHPFFISDSFRLGTIDYNGNLYHDVPLMYDIYKDLVVSKDFSATINIRLSGEKISWFQIGENRFTRIDAGTAVSPGFYEVLYHSSYTVLAKHEKKILESKTEANSAKFIETNYFFVGKEESYHAISSESDLSALFSDRRAEIRKFLNRKEINFKKDPAAAIVRTVEYYEQMKK